MTEKNQEEPFVIEKFEKNFSTFSLDLLVKQEFREKVTLEELIFLLKTRLKNMVAPEAGINVDKLSYKFCYDSKSVEQAEAPNTSLFEFLNYQALIENFIGTKFKRDTERRATLSNLKEEQRLS